MVKKNSKVIQRGIKRNHILNIIADNKDLSKLNIKNISGYSMSSVISIIQELNADGLITEEISPVSGGGRPPSIINIDPLGGYIIGVDFAFERINLKVFNLRREPILQLKCKDKGMDAAISYIDKIIKLINSALNRLNINANKLLGIGIGVPGHIDERKGTVSKYPYIMGYSDMPLRDILYREFKVPIVLENNVNAMALGYKWLVKSGKVNSMLLIGIRRGIKASLIINNKLIKGAEGYAGEIGRLIYKDGITYEAILSEDNVINNLNINSVSEIEALLVNDKEAISYIDNLVKVTASLIDIFKAIINPEEILLVGGYAGSGYFVDRLNRVYGNIKGGSAEDLGTIGAAGLVIEKLYSY